MLRGRLSGLSLPGSNNLDRPLTVSAYADDVNIFVSSQGDVQCLQDTLSLFEKASSARVNWAKSEALLVGQWRSQAVPSLPGGLEWGKEGLKVLGLFLGTEGFQNKWTLGCLDGNGCYPSCRIGEEFWWPITWSPRLFGIG